MFIYKNNFCLIWKPDGISFDKAIKEIKDNFKVVDNVASDEHVKSFFKNIYKHKKVQSPLINIVVYDLETFNKTRAVPCCSCIYILSKISDKYHRDISQQENQKCLNDCVFLKEPNVLMNC